MNFFLLDIVTIYLHSTLFKLLHYRKIVRKIALQNLHSTLFKLLPKTTTSLDYIATHLHSTLFKLLQSICLFNYYRKT